ncbi:MAG TPA: glutathione S-transferase family protein [Dokdonella sp.]|uniref:glutathione S-transferase family protein n=1 Tax=Dokdonella sp. TaxID=2291710 RepID=UPI0025BB3953|nr:glutathione S-transferase family protein [Dokdonella sp.]MBX3691500.1 glutathione S-transferase family protein [Dokdonella sp.]MCW5566757.1 glutathione S-transferase family protein [Dokdonella sp.]HNR91052.1 glutathione S-transferase family protein [Dokdonella sp.]
MYTLYYSPGAASMAVHLTLLEIGAPHSLRLIDFDTRAQKDPEYLRLNPNGMVPTLIVDGQAVYECAALLLLLGERHPEAGLAPAPGATTRGLYLQWMLHLANTLQPAFRQWFHPGDFGPPGDDTTLRDYARRRIEACWDRLDAHLAANGPHVLGAELSIADFYATMLMRWSRNMPKPADRWPALAALAARVKARPSWSRLYAIEGLSEWA